MNSKVLHVLEYDKIVAALADCADSEPGKKLCRGLAPTDVAVDIRRAQEETAAALGRLIRCGSVSFGANYDMAPTLAALSVQASLSSAELLRIAGFLTGVSAIREYGGSGDETDALTDYFCGLYPLTPLVQEIRRCIIEEDLIADDASPELRRIRREIARTEDRVHTTLTSELNSKRTYLQDSVIAMRDGRYCLCVRAENRQQVNGIVHDTSSTGASVFIEPASVVELGNKLTQLAIEEKREIERILADLSAACAQHVPELASNSRQMTALDFAFAKGKLALSMNATMPIYDDSLTVSLRRARHPLLDPKRCVPIDVTLGFVYDLLVITGPNTGGKTVTLKTVGLLSLMGQAGLHIPAGDRSKLAIFHEIYADIGDEQSIEQSLSTFSSHMTSIVNILRDADSRSLCLFDELGAGTDPTEGAALATAILDRLHAQHILTMATTHYSELKLYALQTPGVENACCEFDIETLSPTYRLLVGIPGKSNAFAISQKLGLASDIIEDAQSRIDRDAQGFEDVIASLERARVQTEQEHSIAQSKRLEIDEQQRRLDEQSKRIGESRDQMLSKARAEAQEIISNAKKQADAAISELNKARSTGDVRGMEQARSKLRKEAAAKSAPPVDSEPLSPESLKALMNSNAIAEGQTRRPKPKSADISPEIVLIGMTADEASEALAKYLDDAVLAHLDEVRIVHGKGTGALRNAVRQVLSRDRRVQSYRAGAYGEGDAGVTIASL